MGEVDFSGDSLLIYSLLPPQPDGVSAGNVEYSSTNPDVIAFNYIDENDNWDIKIYNYDNPSENLWITFPDRNVQRPSFSHDDNALVVDRFTDSKLLVLDLDDFTFTVLSDISVNARYPEWIVIGGIVDQVKEQAGQVLHAFSLEQNYPNPFNPVTNITFTVPKSENVKIEIFNITGQRIRLLLDKQMSPGTHNIAFDALNLASGVYWYRISAGEFRAARKMVLLR